MDTAPTNIRAHGGKTLLRSGGKTRALHFLRRYTSDTKVIPVERATRVLDVVAKIYDCGERPELWLTTIQSEVLQLQGGHLVG